MGCAIEDDALFCSRRMQFEGVSMTAYGVDVAFQLLGTNDANDTASPSGAGYTGAYRRVVDLFNRLGSTQAPSDLFAILRDIVVDINQCVINANAGTDASVRFIYLYHAVCSPF